VAASGPADTLAMMSTKIETNDSPSLSDVHAPAPVAQYLSELWARRSYIWYASASELRGRQTQQRLGNFWHLLNPLLSIATYYLVFGLLLKIDRGVDNFILFLTIGIFMFQYTQMATLNGAKSVISNRPLIRAVRFPRALLPITSTVTETLAAVSSLVVIYITALLTGEDFRWQWVLLPTLGALQFVFNTGLSFVFARATTHIRDLTQLLPFAFRLLLYGSGIIWSVDEYADGDYAWLFTINPVYALVSLGRWCVMGGTAVTGELISVTIWASVLLTFGLLWFRAGEQRFSND
jgi:teichoic acid transport system permease protein